MHTVPLQEEHFTKQDHVMIRTSLPIKWWIEDIFHGPTSTIAQTPILTKRHPIYHTLSPELQVLLAPVKYVEPTNTPVSILW